MRFAAKIGVLSRDGYQAGRQVILADDCAVILSDDQQRRAADLAHFVYDGLLVDHLVGERRRPRITWVLARAEDAGLILNVGLVFRLPLFPGENVFFFSRPLPVFS